MADEFPWHLLKAESMRAVCRDLGFGAGRRRDDMLDFLGNVHQHGVQSALDAKPSNASTRTQHAPAPGTTRATTKTTINASPNSNSDPTDAASRKRRSDNTTTSEYNTRFRHKRVRLVPDPAPLRRRPPPPATSAVPAPPIIAPASASTGPVPKTVRRGRPPNVSVTLQGPRRGPQGIFDGVEMPARGVWFAGTRSTGKERENEKGVEGDKAEERENRNGNAIELQNANGDAAGGSEPGPSGTYPDADTIGENDAEGDVDVAVSDSNKENDSAYGVERSLQDTGEGEPGDEVQNISDGIQQDANVIQPTSDGAEPASDAMQNDAPAQWSMDPTATVMGFDGIVGLSFLRGGE